MARSQATSRRKTVKLPVILGANSEGHVIVPARPARQGWWVVEFCPFCGGEHHHGPLEGTRQAHCQPGGIYYLQLVEN